jgi:hypothetical protein
MVSELIAVVEAAATRWIKTSALELRIVSRYLSHEILVLTSMIEYGVSGLIFSCSACHVVGRPSLGQVYGFAYHQSAASLSPRLVDLRSQIQQDIRHVPLNVSRYLSLSRYEPT